MVIGGAKGCTRGGREAEINTVFYPHWNEPTIESMQSTVQNTNKLRKRMLRKKTFDIKKKCGTVFVNDELPTQTEKKRRNSSCSVSSPGHSHACPVARI